MNLSVAVWMDQDAVLCVVCPTECFIHNMVVVPSRYLGNRMATDWADASLFLPEIHQSSSSLQGLFHLYAQAFFKIEFPCRIVGVAIPFDLGVFSDGCCGSQAQPVLDGFTTLLFCRAEEARVLVSESAKIPVLHPLLALLWMSTFCPSPQHFEDGSIYTDKGLLGICVSVIVRPSPYFGVECRYQPVCCSLFVILNDFSDARKERLHVLLRRFNKELPVILTYMLPEKVKSLLDVRYPGFLFREFQSSWLQICDHEGFDFVFQDLFRVSCYDESSSAGESHPHALTDPDVNLSAHPAPIVQPQAVPPSANAQRGAAAVGQSVRANAWPGVDGLSASYISAWPNGPESGPGPGRSDTTRICSTAHSSSPIHAGWD